MDKNKKQFIIENLCYAVIMFVALCFALFLNFGYALYILALFVAVAIFFYALKLQGKWYKLSNKRRSVMQRVILTIIFILAILLPSDELFIKLLCYYVFAIVGIIFDYRTNFHTK